MGWLELCHLAATAHLLSVWSEQIIIKQYEMTPQGSFITCVWELMEYGLVTRQRERRGAGGGFHFKWESQNEKVQMKKPWHRTGKDEGFWHLRTATATLISQWLILPRHIVYSVVYIVHIVYLSLGLITNIVWGSIFSFFSPQEANFLITWQCDVIRAMCLTETNSSFISHWVIWFPHWDKMAMFSVILK